MRQNVSQTDTGALYVASDNRPSLTLADWLSRELAEPDFLLGQILCTSCRVILVGPTGLGKTMLALAVATGRQFLHWNPGRRGKVLFVDGEMSRRTMKRRLAEAARRAGVDTDEDAQLVVLSREDFEDMPPLNTPSGQRWLDAFILKHGPFDLVIFDNIQALTVGDLKDEESWSRILPWVRSLTRRNMGQLWLHHTGHDESRSYGSKAREWQMDTVILMERVSNTDDLAFSIKFTKARERTPENRADYEPITMKLINDEWRQGGPIEKSTRLNDRYRNALAALTAIAAQCGEPLPPSWKLPSELRGVRVNAWRNELGIRGIIETDDKNPRATFRRIREALKTNIHSNAPRLIEGQDSGGIGRVTRPRILSIRPRK